MHGWSKRRPSLGGLVKEVELDTRYDAQKALLLDSCLPTLLKMSND